KVLSGSTIRVINPNLFSGFIIGYNNFNVLRNSAIYTRFNNTTIHRNVFKFLFGEGDTINIFFSYATIFKRRIVSSFTIGGGEEEDIIAGSVYRVSNVYRFIPNLHHAIAVTIQCTGKNIVATHCVMPFRTKVKGCTIWMCKGGILVVFCIYFGAKVHGFTPLSVRQHVRPIEIQSSKTTGAVTAKI